jgi:hypothetical protein
MVGKTLEDTKLNKNINLNSLYTTWNRLRVTFSDRVRINRQVTLPDCSVRLSGINVNPGPNLHKCPYIPVLKV